MAGYSGTPLPKKLGMTPGARLMLVAAPTDFDDTLGELPDEVKVVRRLAGHADVIVCFVTARAELEGRIDRLERRSSPTAGCGWPGRSGPRACRPT